MWLIGLYVFHGGVRVSSSARLGLTAYSSALMRVVGEVNTRTRRVWPVWPVGARN